MTRKFAFACAAIALMSSASPSFAGVKEGVDAWGRGDYAVAVREWRTSAIAGDADAQFNLGQAYKLGRGVPVDLRLAQEWYQKAAAQGHLQAEDNYGLILFQNGDRQRALPIIARSADRGDARAQYIYGTALFNGDMIAKDWPRAYAYMTRASQSGLSAASNSLAQMDKFIPMEQRQRGLVMARELEARAQRPQLASNTRLGAPSLPAGPAIGSTRIEPYPLPPSTPEIQPGFEPASPVMSAPSAPAPIARGRRGRPIDPPVQAEAPRAPREVADAGPTWRTGRAEALPRPGSSRRPADAPQVPVENVPYPSAETLPPPPTQSWPAPDQYPPAAEPQPSYDPPVYDGAGTSYPVPGTAPRPRPAPAPVVRKPAPAQAPVVRKQAPAPAPVRAVSGGYRVQLGAFSDQGRAKAMWSSVSNQVSGLRGLQPYLVRAGAITRLQAGPLTSRTAAEKLCGQVKGAGQSCLVVSN